MVASTWAYDAYGALESSTTKVSGATVFQETIVRDALARPISKAEVVQGVTVNWAYGYDAANRLQQVTKDGAMVGAYLFDANGNRTSASGVAATFDSQDRLLAVGPVRYSYDAFGSLLEKRDTSTAPGRVTQYQHDGNGGLRKATLPDGTVLDYLVDARARRVGKKRNGVLERGWLYDGQLRIVAELDGSGSVTSRFVYGVLSHSPDYLERNGVAFRFVHDSLGSVRLVVNATTGSIAQRIDYDAWGVVLADSAPGFQPFGFAGGLYDADMGLVRFGARDYDAAAARWTANDAIRFGGGDTNLYAYAGGDPVNRIDTDGRVWKLVTRVAGAGIRAIRQISRQQAIDAYRRGQDVATDRAKDARKLAKDASKAEGGGGAACHPEQHGNGARHLHGLDEAGRHVGRGHVFIEAFKDALIFFADPNDNGEMFDSDDIYELTNPLPVDTRSTPVDPYEMI